MSDDTGNPVEALRAWFEDRCGCARTGICGYCKSRPVLDAALDAAKEEGRREERAAIVQGHRNAAMHPSDDVYAFHMDAAAEIEAGFHHMSREEIAAAEPDWPGPSLSAPEIGAWSDEPAILTPETLDRAIKAWEAQRLARLDEALRTLTIELADAGRDGRGKDIGKARRAIFGQVRAALADAEDLGRAAEAERIREESMEAMRICGIEGDASASEALAAAKARGRQEALREAAKIAREEGRGAALSARALRRKGNTIEASHEMACNGMAADIAEAIEALIEADERGRG